MSNEQMIKQGKYGWVDLSNLVKRGKRIHWEKSIGKTIDFQYDDVRSTITISGYYNNKQVYIDIDGYVSNCLVHTSTILKAQLGHILNKKYLNNFKYNINDIVNDTLLITKKYRNDKQVKVYDYVCLKDGYCGTKTELDISRGKKCPVCCGIRVLKGYNDIATTHPELIQYFKNKEDSTQYSIHSGKSTWFVCPDCGNEKYTTVDSAFSGGYFSCSSCRDGSSYNNKFIYCLLKQIQKISNIKIYTEHSFEWSRRLNNPQSKKIYDFYIQSDTSIIIEAHGAQHYNGGFEYCGGHNLQQEQENDLFKYNLAIKNGFTDDTYIVIDCRKSKVDFIKQSIMNSNLPKLLKFSESDIDWNLCNEYASSNIVKTACEYWNNGIHNASEIARMIGKASCTVSEYLQKGNELGWIEYEPNMNMPVMCLDWNYVFSNSTMCSQYSEELFGVFISKKSIINHLCGDTKSTHGLHFQHITRKEFNQIKEDDSYIVFE